jgi:hypothetical protein
MNNSEEQLKRGKEIKMSPDEKGMIRFALLQKIIASARGAGSPASVSSPYVRNLRVIMHAVRSPFHFPHAFKVLALVLIVGVGGGTSLSYASENSLPGDTLYTFKVNVSEPMRGVLAVSKESKATFHADLIVKRVGEAKTLKETGELTPEKTEIVKTLIEKESETFVAAAVDLQEDGKNEEAAVATSVILATLTDYQETVVDDTAHDTPFPAEDTATLSSEEDTLAKSNASISTMSIPSPTEETPDAQKKAVEPS